MNIRCILGYLTVLLLLPGCSKEDRSAPFAEQKPIQIRAFLQEGDSIRPLGADTRAVDGTLSNGYYIEIAKYGSSYDFICKNTKVMPDGTLETPAYWWQDTKNYRIEAYAFPDGRKYDIISRFSDGMCLPSYSLYNDPNKQEDVLVGGYAKITVSYDKPIINIYFQHAFSRIKFKLIRTATGPTLYDVSFKVNYVKIGNQCVIYPLSQTTLIPNSFTAGTYNLGSTFNFLASETKPVDIADMILIPQAFSKGGMLIEMSYKIDPADTEYKTLTSDLPTFTTEQGEQVEILLGCDVQIDKLNVQQVTLSPWTTTSGILDIYK